MLGGGLATVGFAITSGVFYGKSRQGYERAVDIYNDSLGMRLGLLDGEGNYLPPRGALVDADGNVVLDPGDEPPAVAIPTPVEPAAQPEPEPEPALEPAPDPTEAAEAGPESAPAADPAPEAAEPPAADATPADPAPEASASVPEPAPTTLALQLQPRR